MLTCCRTYACFIGLTCEGHIIGLGTLWEYNGVAGPDSINCPYYGPKANAEFAKISGGCAVVPTELDGGPGTRCGHWDDRCLKDELMTGYLSGTTQPLSRITIGSLEDMGYEVDYSAADPFGSGDLRTCPGCRRELASVLDHPHGSTRQLGLRYYPNKQPRKLSEPLRLHAIEQGLALLKKKAASAVEVPEGYTYVGDKVISVVVQEGESLFGVIVKNE